MVITCLILTLMLTLAASATLKPVAYRDVSSIVLDASKQTLGRRSTVPQMAFVGASKYTSHLPTTMQCTNKGWDGMQFTWACQAQLPNGIDLDRVEVICEDWDPPVNDATEYDIMTAGSCGVEYTLRGDIPAPPPPPPAVVQHVQHAPQPQYVHIQQPVYVPTPTPPPPPRQATTNDSAVGAIIAALLFVMFLIIVCVLCDSSSTRSSTTVIRSDPPSPPPTPVYVAAPAPAPATTTYVHTTPTPSTTTYVHTTPAPATVVINRRESSPTGDFVAGMATNALWNWVTTPSRSSSWGGGRSSSSSSSSSVTNIFHSSGGGSSSGGGGGSHSSSSFGGTRRR